MSGVLQPRIEHHRIECCVALTEVVDRLGDGPKVCQICNTGLNRSRQRCLGLTGPFCITTKDGQLISTGQQDLCRFKPDPAACTSDQDSALLSCRHGL